MSTIKRRSRNMRKLVIVLMIVMLSTTLVTSGLAGDKKGGCLPFLGSCCLGPRIGLEMNEGRQVRTLEWLLLVPYVGLFTRLWMSIEAYDGKTMSEIAAEENL